MIHFGTRLPIVLDASTTIASSLTDERHPYALAASSYVEEHGALVPALWRWEVQNTLLIALKRKRASEPDIIKIITLLSRSPISIDPPTMFGAELALARQYELTIYDAAYLELAMRSRCMLATVDSALAKAAQTAGVFWIA
ncbi:MAG: type II toxin-antitoxin system VapC family toxin [Candidatus Eremiobacteraeota bacterium]|nr:type II toxin-antitoxin system VapC family toxin [Candidatus Eremiobacteraeota bacterium]